MTSAQTEAVCEVAKRVVDGTINPLRRDIRVFGRKRLALSTLASDRVTLTRKKETLRRHRRLLPVLLRERYVIRTIIEEIRTALTASEP